MTRMDDMLERWGECVKQTEAAHILGRSTKTISTMIKDGRLRMVCGGSMVDVRSIAEYFEQPAEKDEQARLKRRFERTGISCRFHV